jgi:hypothetical protein
MTDEDVAALLRPQPAPPPPAPEQSRLDKFLGAVGKGVNAVGTGLSDALDAATLNWYRRGRDALTGLVAPESTRQMQAQEGQFHQEHPYASATAHGLGYFIPGGAPVRLAEAGTAGVRALSTAIPALAARPLAGALVGATTGGGTAAAEDVSAGVPLRDALADAGKAALVGAGMGAVSGGIAAGAGRARAALRNPQGEIGRTIQTLEQTAAARSTPEFKALPRGAEGFNEAATKAEEQLAAHNQRVLRDARAAYGKDLERILSTPPGPEPLMSSAVPEPITEGNETTPIPREPMASMLPDQAAQAGPLSRPPSPEEAAYADRRLRPTVRIPRQSMADMTGEAAQQGPPRTVPTDRVHDLLDRLDSANTVNGVTVDEHQGRAIDKVRRMLTKDTGQLDYRASVEQGEPVTIQAPAATIQELMKVKQAVAGLADYGAPATPETRPYRLIDKAIGQDLEAADPRIADLNKRYAETMGRLETANDIMYGAQSPDVMRSTAKQKRARGLLGRVGDNTQAATLARKDLERLKDLDPEYRDILAPVEGKKAVERSRFGLPHVSRRIEHLPWAFVQQNANALGVRLAEPALGRLAGVNPTGLASNPILRAYEDEQRREAERASLLGGR